MKHRLDAGKGSAGNADPLARLEQRLCGLGLFALAQQADQRVVDPGRPGAETDEPLHTQGGAHGRPACAAAIAAKPHKQVAGEHGLNNHRCPLAADFFHAQPGQVAAVALAFQIDEGRLFLPRFGVDQVPGGSFVRVWRAVWRLRQRMRFAWLLSGRLRRSGQFAATRQLNTQKGSGCRSRLRANGRMFHLCVMHETAKGTGELRFGGINWHRYLAPDVSAMKRLSLERFMQTQQPSIFWRNFISFLINVLG